MEEAYHVFDEREAKTPMITLMYSFAAFHLRFVTENTDVDAGRG